jgi:L-asparagine transporter-like permease
MSKIKPILNFLGTIIILGILVIMFIDNQNQTIDLRTIILGIIMLFIQNSINK